MENQTKLGKLITELIILEGEIVKSVNFGNGKITKNQSKRERKILEEIKKISDINVDEIIRELAK